MKTWLITDTHFYDDDMVKYLGRPYNHTSLIVKRWNSRIRENDLVIHLGDLTSNHVKTREEIMPKLNGRKILVLGNHDDKSMNWYYDAGFMGVFHAYKYYNLYLTHIPVKNLPEGTTANIHGHFHNNPRKKWDHSVGPKNFLLSIEEEKYYPVLLDDFLGRHKLLDEFRRYKKFT